MKLILAILSILAADFSQPPAFKRVRGDSIPRKPARVKFSPLEIVGQRETKGRPPLIDEALALAGNPAGCDPAAAILLQSLTADQIRVGAACLFDGMTQLEAAEKFNLSPATVCRYLQAVEAVRDRLKIPARQLPKPDTRHVRQLGGNLYASL